MSNPVQTDVSVQADPEKPSVDDTNQRLRFERRFKWLSFLDSEDTGLPKSDWASFCADVDALEVRLGEKHAWVAC
jgi:hypothetical protein